jgi:hypothetical protein
MSDDIAALGHRAVGVIEGLDRNLARLDAKAASWSDILLRRVRHDFDFNGADACLRELDATLRKHPDATFYGFGTHDNSLAAIRDNLRSVVESLAPFRGK